MGTPSTRSADLAYARLRTHSGQFRVGMRHLKQQAVACATHPLTLVSLAVAGWWWARNRSARRAAADEGEAAETGGNSNGPGQQAGWLALAISTLVSSLLRSLAVMTEEGLQRLLARWLASRQEAQQEMQERQPPPS